MQLKTIRHKRPIYRTELGLRVRQARLSLHETQPEFAKRFMVNVMTIHNWESGRSEFIRPINRHLLTSLLTRLQTEGRLINDDYVRGLLEKECRSDPAISPILVGSSVLV